MIITTYTGRSFDTEKDLSAPERHVLQKLFLWKSMAKSIPEFRKEKEKALHNGWNQSGPIQESPNLKIIIKHLERQLLSRLNKSDPKTQSG